MKTKYIETRLNDQMKYYSTKCKSLRKEYLWLSSISIIINAIIPVLSMAVDVAGFLKYVIAALSSTVSVLSGLLLLRKTKESWIKFRSTYESLKREKVLFETSSGKYKTATEEDFIETCEEIMRAEHGAWEALHQNTSNQKE